MRSRSRRRLRRTRLSLTLARVRRSTAAAGATAAACAVLAGATASDLLGDAAAARDRWGRTVDVLVLVHPVRAGETLDEDDVRVEARPVGTLPAGAARADRGDEVVGRAALTELHAGEVVVTARIGDDLLPPGWRGLVVAPPGSDGHPATEVGDAVELVDIGEGGRAPVAAIVLAVEDGGALTVAVPADAVADVAYAAAAGNLVVSVIEAPPRR